ncbi:MAG TPA: glycosyltransferase [Thermoanaerobaculia bacterium]
MTPRFIVTGMHRSGTSFVASLLSAWNVRMGDQLLPADRGNPNGYFEDLQFLDLNRRILAACTPPEAEGYRDWGWTEGEAFDASSLPAFRAEADELIAARDRAGDAWGWKDPRTSVLLDFWDERLGGEARFLLLYRHPWEVADSMLRTGAAVWLNHPEYAARIWIHYNRRLLDFHNRHRDRTLLVSTNRLLEETSTFAALLRERFGIDADAETVARLRAKESLVPTPDDHPLPRLWHFAHRDAMDLLGALDDAADLGNDRRWEAATRRSAPPLPEHPRLSIVIPCLDDGEYLIDAVASVERNAPSAELIVVDDRSTQHRTREVLDAMREAGHRVIEGPGSGLSAARNAGIEASAGEYFLTLDADNRLLAGFAAEAVRLLDADPAAGVAFGDRREFGERSGDVVVPELDLPRMLWSNYIDACAVVRRAVWSEAGGYDVAFRDWEDWDFWLVAGERGWRFIRIPGPAFEYRVRPESVHHRFLRGDDTFPTLHRIYEKHRRSLAEHAMEALEAAHTERLQLLRDIELLRDARDVLQTNIDRLAAAAPSAAQVEEPEQPLSGETKVFTIVARNYFAYARVLAASLARHNPGTKLNVVVLDDPGGEIAPEPSIEIIRPDELPFDPPSDFYTMAAIYDVTELATAVKPWVFEHLFAGGAPVVIYLDPDIEVFDSLGPLEPLAQAHGMVLTPHVTEPLPRDGKRPNERDLLLAGMYNLGFLALSGDKATTFLPWWRERLRRECLNDPINGLFVDQRWMDFAPGLFDPYILRDPGYNVAYWNLPNRTLSRDGDRINVDGFPLRFFHYSGFDPRTPRLLSRHQHESQRVRPDEIPLLGELCSGYADALMSAGFRKYSSLSYELGTAVTLKPGVNVYGYAYAESGTGQIIRSVVSALAAEGIPYAVVPFTRTISRQERAFGDFGTGVPQFDTNLICVNADQVPIFFESMRSQLPSGARNIGLWAWEVEEFPEAMAGSERYLDEVWGISRFTAEALSLRLTKPVRAFPLPVVVPRVRRRTRAELGMPEGFLFLFCFDYDSVFRRKNPLAAVAAFRQAFADRDDVVLFIKTTNAGRHPREEGQLRAAVAGHSNIVIRDAYVTSDDYFSMLDACDCYVSLHRSEGFGLTVAEAMAFGKPVITTSYSATLEFTNDANSFPVPAQMVPVGDDAPPYPPRARWAEPDVAIAAEQMAWVFADRVAAAAVAERARAEIEQLHGPSTRGPLLRRLIDESRQTPRSDAMPTEPTSFEADAMAAEALLGSPRSDLPSRMQRLAKPFRSLALRLIRVYWVQQLGVDRAMLKAMRTLHRETRDEMASLGADLRALRDRIEKND